MFCKRELTTSTSLTTDTIKHLASGSSGTMRCVLWWRLLFYFFLAVCLSGFYLDFKIVWACNSTFVLETRASYRRAAVRRHQSRSRQQNRDDGGASSRDWSAYGIGSSLQVRPRGGKTQTQYLSTLVNFYQSCRHADVMKKIIETVAEGGGDLGVHMYPYLKSRKASCNISWCV